MRMLRIPLALLITLAMLWMAIAPVLAGDGGGHKIGDKFALPSGDETTVIGFDAKGNPIYQAVIGDPIYIKGTDTKYDIEWYPDGNGGFYAGDNDFNAEAYKTKVKVKYQEKNSQWSPDFKINGLTKAEKSVTPTLLAVDPINPNYTNNTLMWDYGNGVKRYLRLIEGMLLEYYIIEQPLNADIEIQNNIIKDTEFKWHRPPAAWDANNEPIDLTYTQNGSLTITEAKSKKTTKGVDLVYPLTIDPDTTFTSTASDVTLWQAQNVYATAHDATNALFASDTWDSMVIGQRLQAGEYRIWRGGLYFDTSGLDDATTVSAAVLKLWGSTDASTADFDIQVQSGMDTYPHDPAVVGDYLYTQFAGDGGSFDTAGFVINAYNSLTLDATGRGWVNLTGWTKFMLVSDEDIADSAPVGDEYVLIETYERGAGFRPELVVTYTIEAPDIQADAASNIAKTSARLNATVLTDGGQSCQVRFGYGTTTQTAGNFALYDTLTAWSAAEWTTSEHPFYDASGLNANDQYFYRAQIKNDDSTVTSTNEIDFTTLNVVSEPENLRAYPNVTSIDISWVKGEGSSKTMVRYGTSTFPTAVGEGTLVYFDTGNAATQGGLVGGKTYYISAWGESAATYSASYSTVAVTTLAFESESDDLETPTMFDRWFGEPDYTNLSNLEPIYSAVNGVADSFGTPRNTAWVVGYLMIVAIVSVGLMMTRGGFAAGLVVSIILLLAGVGMQILPAWMIFMSILLGVFGWAMNKRGFSTE